MSDAKAEPSPSKVQKLSSEASSEADSTFLNKTQKILEDIDSCQNEIDSLNDKASEEILKIEQKFNKLRKPHFDKRNELIKSIPNFWVSTFINHPQLGAILAEEEEQCLHHLKQMCVEENEDIKSGYKISFTFSENPFFTNAVLTKEFHLSTSEGSPCSTSTPIQWKANMDLSDKSKLSPRSKKRKRSQRGSFFCWYSASSDPTTDELAEVLKDDIWPNPLQYFLSPEVNGVSDSSSDESNDEMDDSVVVVGDDDDDDDDDVYAVDHDSDDEDDEDIDDYNMGIGPGDSIEVDDDDDDDDDDDAVEVISDVEEIFDSSKDVADTTHELETTKETVDESVELLLDETADDNIEEEPDDGILDDTADASIDSLNQTAEVTEKSVDSSMNISQESKGNEGKAVEVSGGDGDAKTVEENSKANDKNEEDGEKDEVKTDEKDSKTEGDGGGE